MSEKIQPVIFGGFVVGALSVVPLLNYCCCLWALAGGALAVYVYVGKTPEPLRAGDGALLGLMAGAVGAFVYLLINIPLGIIVGASVAEEALREARITLPVGGVALVVLTLTAVALMLVGLATVGGIIGVALFEKRKSDADVPPPPPPPSFGGPTGGSFGAGL